MKSFFIIFGIFAVICTIVLVVGHYCTLLLNYSDEGLKSSVIHSHDHPTDSVPEVHNSMQSLLQKENLSTTDINTIKHAYLQDCQAMPHTNKALCDCGANLIGTQPNIRKIVLMGLTGEPKARQFMTEDIPAYCTKHHTTKAS